VLPVFRGAHRIPTCAQMEIQGARSRVLLRNQKVEIDKEGQPVRLVLRLFRFGTRNFREGDEWGAS
jgi:hypothetical protein